MTGEAIPDGELAAVVTYLEMRAPPAESVPTSGLRLSRVARPTPDHYRAIFRKVGAPWLWFSRLVMDDAKLEVIIADPAIERFPDPRLTGILPLDCAPQVPLLGTLTSAEERPAS